MERQRGLEICHSTAPEDHPCGNGFLLCLHRALYFGFGGVLQPVKKLCCGLLKEIPTDPSSANIF